MFGTVWQVLIRVISWLFFCALFFSFSVHVNYSWFSGSCASFYLQMKQFFTACQLGQPGVFYHSVQRCESRSLEGPINLSTKHSFSTETFCYESVTYIVCHKLREKSFLWKGGKTLKKAVTSQEISIFGAKEENPRCFCFASNHTQRRREHHCLCLLCCWFGI